MTKKEKQKKFMECETLEEFIEKYKMFHKQELALENGRSYFDVKTSNVDGHFLGESFDNAIRIIDRGVKVEKDKIEKTIQIK